MLSDLCERGWVVAQPPREEDDSSVIARVQGEPVKAGFKIETVKNDDQIVHERFRSGQYDVSLKIDYMIGRSQLRVDRAEGYDADEN